MEVKKSSEEIAAAEAAKKLADDKAAADAKAKADADDSSQNRVKKELEKARKPRTAREKLLYSKKRIEEQLTELEDEGDESEAIDDEEDDSKPLTVGDLKRMRKEDAKKSALQMADGIEDEDDRELVKHYIQTKIIPSGNPKEDLEFAQAAVNSVKSRQIAEELARKGKSKSSGSGSGAPARNADDGAFEPTQEEVTMARFAKIPASKQEDWIKATRKKIADAQG